MPPSNLFRAMLPLRSFMTGLTTSSSPMATFLLPQITRSSLSLTSRRAASTSTEDQPQSQQQIPPSSTTRPSATAEEAKATLPSLRDYPYTLKTGTVTSVGKMDRTVRVAHNHTTYDAKLHKTYPKVTTYFVADPQNSLREGDVVEFSSGFPKSRRVRHVIERIIAPFGSPIEERPAVLSREKREAIREQKRAVRWQRREQRKTESGDVGAKEHIGRIRKLVLERDVAN